MRNLVLNLAGVDYIDSTGLGALVMCATTVRKAGGNVKLVNLNRRNIELLVMTKLATVFEIFTDEQDAINSYYPDRKIKTFDILDFVQQDEERGIAADGTGGHRRRGRGIERGGARTADRSAPGNHRPGKRPRDLLRRLRAAVLRGGPHPRSHGADHLHSGVLPQGAEYRRAHRRARGLDLASAARSGAGIGRAGGVRKAGDRHRRARRNAGICRARNCRTSSPAHAGRRRADAPLCARAQARSARW